MEGLNAMKNIAEMINAVRLRHEEFYQHCQATLGQPLCKAIVAHNDDYQAALDSIANVEREARESDVTEELLLVRNYFLIAVLAFDLDVQKAVEYFSGYDDLIEYYDATNYAQDYVDILRKDEIDAANKAANLDQQRYTMTFSIAEKDFIEAALEAYKYPPVFEQSDKNELHALIQRFRLL
jgi:hypothetical protein